MANTTDVIPYPSLPHRRVPCIVSTDDTSDASPTFFGEADAWLTKIVPENEASSSQRFAAAQCAEVDDLVAQGVLSISHIDETVGQTIFTARFLDEISHVGMNLCRNMSSDRRHFKYGKGVQGIGSAKYY